MTDDIVSENESRSGSKPCSAFGWGILLLATDIIVYGWMIPIFTIYVGGQITCWVDLDFGTVLETVTAMIFVYLLLTVIFQCRLESKFWKYFFAAERGFQGILQIRDAINTMMLTYLMYKLVTIIQLIILDGAMKDDNLHDGLFFVTLKPFVDESFIENNLGVCPCKTTFVGEPVEIPATTNDDGEDLSIFQSFIIAIANLFPCFGGNDGDDCEKDLLRKQAIHGAEFLLVMTQISACVTKLIYFSTLYAYMRTMKIAIDMQNSGEFITRQGSLARGITDEDYGYVYEANEDAFPTDATVPVIPIDNDPQEYIYDPDTFRR